MRRSDVERHRLVGELQFGSRKVLIEWLHNQPCGKAPSGLLRETAQALTTEERFARRVDDTIAVAMVRERFLTENDLRRFVALRAAVTKRHATSRSH